MTDLQEIILAPTKPAAGTELVLATVTAIDDTYGLTLRFDGQSAASQKKYKMLNSAGSLIVGDRVVAARHAGTYIVLGRIVAASGKLIVRNGGIEVQSGDVDILDGDLDMQSGDLVLRDGSIAVEDGTIAVSNTIDVVGSTQVVGTAPSSDTSDGMIFLRDKARNVIARILGRFYSDGRIGVEFGAYRKVSNTDVYNSLILRIDSSGNLSVFISSQNAWRGALGLGTNGALPITVAQGGTGSTGISHVNTIRDILDGQSGFTINDARLTSWGKVAQLAVYATVTTTVASTDKVHLATLKSGKLPYSYTAAVEFLNSKKAYLETDGKLYVYGPLFQGDNLNITTTYLLR